MDQKYPQLVNETDEGRQTSRILTILIWASWGIFVFVVVAGLYYKDWKLIAVTLVGSALLIVPMVLLRYGHLHASSFVVALITLGMVTTIATVGQGIRDLAIITLPIVFVFAGLTSNQAFFRLCVGLALAAVSWLGFGEIYGWFVPKPFIGEASNWFYLIGVSIILLIAALAVDLLVSNVRKNLDQAKREIVERKRVEELLRFQSNTDALTGIYNRYFFQGELERLERCREFPVSIVIADVDGLKFVNDTAGHAAGDELLKQAANVLRATFRAGDVLARIGGDEFAVLLPDTDAPTVALIVSRVRVRLAEYNTKFPDLPVQLSLGGATAEESNLAETFTLADQRMYADKSTRKASINHGGGES